MSNPQPIRRGMASRKARTGLTLVEVLVVSAIVGFLAGLMIPSVLAARRAALRAQCVNNFRQLGLALANYASAFDAFPPGNSWGNSIHVAILPLMERKPLYDAINFSAGVSELLANTTVMSATISDYLCPAETQYPVELGDWSWTTYAGNGGVGLQKAGETGAFSPEPGVVVRFNEFLDGMSRTALMSEWTLGGSKPTDQNPRRAVFYVSTDSDAPMRLDEFAALCHNLDVTQAQITRRRKGLDWTRGRFGFSLYNHTVGPNDHSCRGGSPQEGAWTAGSWHPGGVNVLFADGSTRFTRETIAPTVWRALGTRDGGEIISDDAY